MSHCGTACPARWGTTGALTGLVLCLAGCGGSTEAVADAGASSSPSGFTAAAQALYRVPPDPAQCRAGTLSPDEKAGTLAAINAIRATHGLAAVVDDPEGEDEVMQISLMMVANGAMSHAPSLAWNCYTTAGARGGGRSNLYLGGPSPYLSLTSSANILAGWLADIGSEATLGHRRWLLDPFLKQVAFGRVDAQAASGERTTGAAIKVVYSADDTGPVTSDYVAYPVGDYRMAYFPGNAQGYPVLSFSVIADKARRSGNGSSAVDFSATTVSVVQQGGEALTVSGVTANHDGYGVPNSLRFRVGGLQAGGAYDVTVAGVRVNGVTRDYQYGFRLIH